MSYLFLITLFRLFNLYGGHRVVRHGAGRLPVTGGAVIAINHTSYVDFSYIGLEAYRTDRRYLRILAKSELAENPILRVLMKGCGVILVDRSAGREAYLAAVDQLRAGEVVAVYPEATISLSLEIKELKTGAARMALEAQRPIIPAIVWGSQRIAPKGAPRHLGRSRVKILVSTGAPIAPTGTVEELTAQLATAMEVLLREVQGAYGPHPADEPWVPARLGGSAPTPAEADG
ncbi:lysophospholipid acyltransferase family protein [Aeromicrobium sp. CF3.5]|uniref:lysophospholipid acyltransferase family protein n=1 Tax=Aeromicrobium sp. CF3.5 TaxID=3373078 RepID=UPI003EE7B084